MMIKTYKAFINFFSRGKQEMPFQDIRESDVDTVFEGIRAQTLSRIRWIALAGQTLTLIIVDIIFGLEPLIIAFSLQAIAVLFNLFGIIRFDTDHRLSAKAATLQLTFDLAHLTALLFLTGGLANPFTVLILAPTTVAASILPRIYTRILVLVALLGVTALVYTPYPLPFEGPNLEIPWLIRLGVWFALTITLIFLTIYVAKVGRDGRRRAAALSATQLALEREQRLSALGSQAAVAAHELGTPLGSLLLILHDRQAELAEFQIDCEINCEPAFFIKDQAFIQDLAEDLNIMVSEVERCRKILGRLRSPDIIDQEIHFQTVSAEALLREAAAPHETRGPRFDFIDLTDGCSNLLVRRTPATLHGLRNVIENATGFAISKVTLSYQRLDKSIQLIIDDDGPGFDAQIARKIGEPYVTSRTPKAGRDGGMGLGLFIAITLIEREKGKLRISRSPTGGGRVKIDLPICTV